MIPRLIPRNDKLLPSILWHPDLNSSNLITTNTGVDGKQVITSLLDWQGAYCAPLVVQVSMPPAFKYDVDIIELGEECELPKAPANVGSLPPKQRDQVERHLHQASLHQRFRRAMADEQVFKLVDSFFFSAQLAYFIKAALSSWDDGYTWFCESLRRVQPRAWIVRQDLGFMRDVVPVSEKRAHKARFATVLARHQAFRAVLESLGMYAEGWVPTQEYERVDKELAEIKQQHWDEKSMGP